MPALAGTSGMPALAGTSGMPDRLVRQTAGQGL